MSLRTYRLVALIIAFAAFIHPVLHAADWPQWRGPERTGISRETGLAKSWPADGPKRIWRATGLGDGFSTPSVVGNLLFTMGNRDGKELVLALDVAQQGRIAWTVEVGPVRHRGSGYPGPRCTPTVDGDRVYALGLNGDLVCVERTSGREIWRVDLVAKFGGVPPTWGYSESPLVDGERLICTPGGDKAALVALDKAMAETVWTSPPGAGAAYSSIIPARFAEVPQYVQFLDAGVFGFAAKDGALLWRYDGPANGTANIPTPVAFGNSIFAASGYGTGGGAAEIKRSDAGGLSAHERFFSSDMICQHGGVIVIDDHVYGCSDPGIFTCIDLKTGETKWRERAPGKASLIYVDGRFLARSERGKVSLLEATPAACTVVSQFEEQDRSEKPSWPHPVVAAGRLYLRDQDALTCYELKP